MLTQLGLIGPWNLVPYFLMKNQNNVARVTCSNCGVRPRSLALTQLGELIWESALALINYSLWVGFPVVPDRKQLMPESCHFRYYSPYPHPQPTPERTGDYDGSSIHSRWLHLGGFFSLFRCLKVRHRIWRNGPVVKSIRHSSSGGPVFYSCTPPVTPDCL